MLLKSKIGLRLPPDLVRALLEEGGSIATCLRFHCIR